MQIDFHHGTTYVIARLAGMDHPEAEIVAYASQYVDDATNGGSIIFDNGAHYSRISSAHKTLDYHNFSSLANSKVWVPFHFLPGNGGMPEGENPAGSFIEKLVCKPNSFVAKDVVRSCIESKSSRYGLHRLGITMHVYADTWAHQGFAGVNHKINSMSNLTNDNDEDDYDLMEKMSRIWGNLLDVVTGDAIGDAFPLGHGPALSFPDRPWLKWSYDHPSGERVSRDNTLIFLDAADHLCVAIKQFIKGDPDSVEEGLSVTDRAQLEELFRTITDGKGDLRHQKWLDKIAEGHFRFGPVDLDYIPKKEGSWKHKALESLEEKDKKEDVFCYNPGFLTSNWKLFHDALQAHRFVVLHDILPRYGICAD